MTALPAPLARPAWLGLLLSACAVHHGPAAAPGTPAAAVAWIDHAAYPFASRFFDADGGRMHYLDEGQGPVVVLVHGTPSWSFEWRALVRDLARDHRVIAPDHVGFGLSDKPADWAGTPAAHAANLEKLLAHLGVERATLVVHDFGGPIGLAWALAHPERVERLVIFNTWMWDAGEKAAKLSNVVKGALGRYLYLERNFSPRRLAPMSMKVKPSADVLRHYSHPFPDPASRVGPWRLGVELAGSAGWYASLWEKRAAIADIPTLLVWGEADPTFGEAELARWREALPAARVVTLPGVGHFPQEEAPERVVAEVRTFLAR